MCWEAICMRRVTKTDLCRHGAAQVVGGQAHAPHAAGAGRGAVRLVARHALPALRAGVGVWLLEVPLGDHVVHQSQHIVMLPMHSFSSSDLG